MQSHGLAHLGSEVRAEKLGAGRAVATQRAVLARARVDEVPDIV